MGKKKKNKHKKHSFKHADVARKPEADLRSVKQTSTRGHVQPTPGTEFAYVASDLRRITILATCFVALQVVLWYAFENTSLGDWVYKLIKI